MAIVLRGRTPCALCGRVLAEDDDIAGFPAGFFEWFKPYVHLNDAAVHVACLLAEPWGAQAHDRWRTHFALIEALGAGDEATWAEWLEDRRRYVEEG